MASYLLAENFVDPADGRVTSTSSMIPLGHGVTRPNAFYLYRISKMKEMKQVFPSMGNNELAKAVGKLWKDEPKDIKDKFKKTAALIIKNYTTKIKYQRRKPRAVISRLDGVEQYENFNFGAQKVRKA